MGRIRLGQRRAETERLGIPGHAWLLRLIGGSRPTGDCHEHSYLTEDIGDEYPHGSAGLPGPVRRGRSARHPLPTVLITEWAGLQQHSPRDLTRDGGYRLGGAALWGFPRGEERGHLEFEPSGRQIAAQHPDAGLVDNLLAMSLDSF